MSIAGCARQGAVLGKGIVACRCRPGEGPRQRRETHKHTCDYDALRHSIKYHRVIMRVVSNELRRQRHAVAVAVNASQRKEHAFVDIMQSVISINDEAVL